MTIKIPPIVVNKYTIICLLISLNTNLYSQDSTWFDKYIRRIHMDFHTPEFESDIAIKQFNAQEYVGILKAAKVNSLVTFAKGHHGNSYYNTLLGHKHKGLPGETDMMGEIIEECHKNGMKVLSYYSVGWLTTVEKNHPEWMERNQEGEKVGTGGGTRTKTWNCICLNSPYVDKVVLPELREIASNYTMDGIWIDIIENNPCYCENCRSKYKNLYGGFYPDEAAAAEFALETKKEAIKKINSAVKEIKPGTLISFNTAGRDPEIVPMVDFCSIETHPGAGWHQGAWTHALLTMKLLQQYGKPWESTTSRFIHGWGSWDDQAVPNMLAVATRIAAHGGVINLGDQTYPSGKLDTAIYRNIGKVFTQIEKMEKWALNASPVAEVGLFTTPFDIYSIYGRDPQQLDKYLGATKILTDRHWNFNLIQESESMDLSQFKCLVLPNVGEIKASTAEKLSTFVFEGGKLLITANSSYSPSSGNFLLSKAMGVKYKGMSPHKLGYLGLSDTIAQNTRRSPLLVPSQFFEITPEGKTNSLSEHMYPIIFPKPEALFFFRHGEISPPGASSISPGIVAHTYGKGEVIYVAAPIFETYIRQGQWYLKDVADNLLNYLVQKKDMDLHAVGTVEMFSAQKENRLVVTLLNYQLHNETNHVEEIVPKYNVVLKIRKNLVTGEPIEIIAENSAYKLESEGDYYTITLEKLNAFCQLVFNTQLGEH